MPKGFIIPSYYIACGMCGNSELLYTQSVGRNPRDAAKAQGWKMTKVNGWICDECQEATPEEKRTRAESW